MKKRTMMKRKTKMTLTNLMVRMILLRTRKRTKKKGKRSEKEMTMWQEWGRATS